MNIAPDPKAWKPWRRALRVRVKANPVLRREHRKASRLHLASGNGLGALRFAIPAGIGALAWHDFTSGTLIGAMALWTFLVTAIRSLQVANACHFPGELWLFYSWPLSDDAIFAHQRRLILRASLWLGLDWLVFGTVTALRTSDHALLAATPLLSAGQWAAALSVALFCGRVFPRFPYAWVTMPLGLLLFLSIRFPETHSAFGSALDLFRQIPLVATPGGWLLQGWQLIAAGNLFGWLALVLLAGSAFASLRIGARLIRTAFNPEAIFGYHSVPETDATPTPAEAPLASSTPIQPGTVLAALSTPAGRSFTSRGPVEHSLAWFLNPRQRVLVDFMLPGGQPWHRRWTISAALLALAFILRETTSGLALFPSLLAMLFALPVTGGRWSGFDSMPIFQTRIGVHAYAPVGFFEIARLLLKINALHCLLALPLVIAAMGLGLSPTGASAGWALDYGLRVTALLFALQPILLIGKFSANSNDSSAGKLFLLGLVIVILAGLIAGISLCVVALMAERMPIALACIGGLIALTHAMLACYGFAWGRGWFDQMARIRE
jgi:hypothetical protein